MDKGQQLRYSKGDIDLIKQFIASREDALIILRNHFLQLELTEDEQSFLSHLSPAFLKVLEKATVPVLDKDLPMNMEATMYSRLSGLDQVHYELAALQIAANDIIVEYFKQQLGALTLKAEPTIILADLPDRMGIDQKEVRVANMIAYNLIIPLVEGRLNVLSALTNYKEETPEEKAKRLNKNSSQ